MLVYACMTKNNIQDQENRYLFKTSNTNTIEKYEI